MIKRFQAVAPRGAHGNDKPRREIKVFRLGRGPQRDVRLVRMSLREMANRSALVRLAEEKETSPALQAQITEGFQAYLRGDYRPVEEFMAELEAELE